MAAQGLLPKALRFAKDLVNKNGKAGPDLKAIINTLTTGGCIFCIPSNFFWNNKKAIFFLFRHKLYHKNC